MPRKAKNPNNMEPAAVRASTRTRKSPERLANEMGRHHLQKEAMKKAEKTRKTMLKKRYTQRGVRVKAASRSPVRSNDPDRYVRSRTPVKKIKNKHVATAAAAAGPDHFKMGNMFAALGALPRTRYSPNSNSNHNHSRSRSRSHNRGRSRNRRP